MTTRRRILAGAGAAGLGAAATYIPPSPIVNEAIPSAGKPPGAYSNTPVVAAGTSSAKGIVRVFIVGFMMPVMTSGWIVVPNTKTVATATIYVDGSLIVEWGTPGTSSYGQQAFAETIWQMYTVNVPETNPPAPNPGT